MCNPGERVRGLIRSRQEQEGLSLREKEGKRQSFWQREMSHLSSPAEALLMPLSGGHTAAMHRRPHLASSPCVTPKVYGNLKLLQKLVAARLKKTNNKKRCRI